MSRLVVRGAVMMMPPCTVIWYVSASMVISAVFARVRQADLDPVTADHDRAPGGYSPPYLQRLESPC